MMKAQRIELVIVGGGQAGLAMSYLLTEQGKQHVVLEQARVVESWRSKRWDSLRLIAPNWSLRLPGFSYPGNNSDGFMGKDEVVAHLEAYAQSFDAPVQEGVRVTSIERDPTKAEFLVRTENGVYAAAQVVVATGALQRSNVPEIAADLPSSVVQVVSSAYRNPAALPHGAVLVVGSGESGCQIAEELRRVGRSVFLSVGRSWWSPRRYRGQDMTLWFRSVGWFDRTVDELPPGVRTGQVNPQLTGVDGGHDLTLHTLAREGVVLVGRIQDFGDGKLYFASDLAANLAWGDAQALSFLQTVDDYIQGQGLDAPPEEPPSSLRSSDGPYRPAPQELNIKDAGISAVIWATGFRPDLSWIRLPVLDEQGYPIQRRGVTAEPGLYFLGLDWLHTAKSGLFAGVGEDAEHLASVIATRRAALEANVRSSGLHA
jgi:putative flavoprotein involved in K+ transport